MKLIRIRRKTKTETRYLKKQGGVLICRVTRIKKAILGILPFRTLHEYRETYDGQIEDTEKCDNKNVII